MDGSLFSSWTRRRVGLTAGGVAAALIGLADLGSLEAKKKKKKRCKKLGVTCVQGGKRTCCGDLRCDHHGGLNGTSQTFCCKIEGKTCVEAIDCCTPLACFEGSCIIK